jgi:hypothetical protein
MLHRRMTLLVLVAVLAVSALYMAGCPSKPKAPEAPAMTPTPPPAPPPAAKADAKAPAGSFTWTDSPTLEAIPSGPITGMIHGKPFTAKTVRVEQDKDAAVLVISDTAVDKPTGSLMSDVGADLTFDLKSGAPGQKILTVAAKKEQGKQHAYFHYTLGGGRGPMSVNPSWGCALDISEWKVAPDPKEPDVLGTVKGKVAIVFDDEDKSWVAGTFDGVYCK